MHFINLNPKRTTSTKCSKLSASSSLLMKRSEVCLRKALVYFERPKKVNSKHLSCPIYVHVFHIVSFIYSVQ